MRFLHPLAAAALVLAAVTSGASERARAAVTTLKLGVDLPLSGIEGAASVPERNAIVLAIDDANRRGFPGGVRVVLDDLDDSVQGKHDPAQGAQNLKTFVDDSDVFAVVGPQNSNVAKAEIPIANAAGLALISAATTSIELTHGPAARALRFARPERPTFFRVCASDDRQGAAIARFARSRGLRRAYVIDDNETYGRGLADVFASAFPAVGGKILGRDHLTAFAMDYKSLLTKIGETHPDAIFFGGIVNTGGAILRRQMADVGLGGVAYLGGDGLASPDYVVLAGKAADNTFLTVGTPDITHLPASRSFIAAYRARFHEQPGAYSAGAYAAAAAALAGLRATLAAHPGAPPARDDVVAAIFRLDRLVTPLGAIGFDAGGDVRQPIISLYRVRRGRIEYLDEARVSAAAQP